MTETTYKILTDELNAIANKMDQISEQNNLHNLSILSSRLGAIQEDLARLLWIELPELNDGDKFEKLFNRSTGIFFGPGIFEIDAMRQAFFKRQAKEFFDTEEEQQRYINYTENLYLGATKTFKEIMQETKASFPKASYQEQQTRIHSQFVEVMQ